MIRYALSTTDIGDLGLAASGAAWWAVASAPALASAPRGAIRQRRSHRRPAFFADLASSLQSYARGDAITFDDVVLDLRGTPFQLAVWQATRAIPRGQTRSYKQIAETVGRPGASRAVGAAMAANPVTIIIPCHRVVGADGSLCGFGGGLPLKQRLLAMERGQQAF